MRLSPSSLASGVRHAFDHRLAQRRRLPTKPTAPLLVTESKGEFDRIHDALNDKIKPRGIIEQIYVADIANLVWEVLPMRQTALRVNGFPIPLQKRKLPHFSVVLTQLLRGPGDMEYQVGVQTSLNRVGRHLDIDVRVFAMSDDDYIQS